MEGLDEEVHHVFSVVTNHSKLVNFPLSNSGIFFTSGSGIRIQVKKNRIRDEHPQYVGLKIL